MENANWFAQNLHWMFPTVWGTILGLGAWVYKSIESQKDAINDLKLKIVNSYANQNEIKSLLDKIEKIEERVDHDLSLNTKEIHAMNVNFAEIKTRFHEQNNRLDPILNSFSEIRTRFHEQTNRLNPILIGVEKIIPEFDDLLKRYSRLKNKHGEE